MKNKTFYKTTLATCAETRTELNEVHWKRMNQLSRAFQKSTKLKNKDFVSIKNAVYYQGGWPNEKTKPRIETIINNFNRLAQLLAYTDRDEQFKEYCASIGLEVKFIKLEGKASPNAQKAIDKAIELQSVICELADTIKINGAESVKEQCEIKKKHFIDNVNIVVQADKRKRSEKLKAKFAEDVASANNVLEQL